MMLARPLFCALSVATLGAGCFDNSNGGDDDVLGGALTVAGDVVDFQTGAAVPGSVSVTVSGITPPPAISAQGSSFIITEVPENSVFQILASAMSYRPTFSPAIEVTVADVSSLRVPVVSGAYIEQLAAAFGVTPSTGRGVVIVELVGADLRPRAGITSAQLSLGVDARGPFFLDADGNAAAAAQASSASGLVVWFEVAPGSAQAVAAVNAGVAVDMAVAPVAEGTITIARARVLDGATQPMTPTNVSFSRDVFPIFDARGCVACHSGNGAGRDLGGLTLDGGRNLVFRELQERVGRVLAATPEASLLLSKPLKEEPPNHQTATFQNTLDPDYLKILGWIREGAKDN